MKRYTILSLFFSLSFLISNAQVEDYVEVSGAPVGLAIKDNTLYISAFGEGKIKKVDLTQSNPVVDDLVTISLFALPGFPEIDGDLMYVPTVTGIGTIDLSQTNPTFEMLTFPPALFGIAFNGNDLYASRRIGDIYKFDLTQPPLIIGDELTIITDIGTLATLGNINGIALKGNDLYIARTSADKISKIDISQSLPVLVDVISGINSWDLLFVGNDLYFSGDNSVRKIDVTQPNPEIEIIVDNLPSNVIGIEIHDNYLYMAREEENKISRFNLNTLNTEEFQNKKINVYPNPTNDIINVPENLEGKEFEIVDLMGRSLMSGKIVNNSIHISNLIEGIYFLKVKNYRATKIVKS